MCDFALCTPWLPKNFGKLDDCVETPIMLYRLELHEKDEHSSLYLYALSLLLLACKFLLAAALLSVVWWRWWRRRVVVSFRERERERKRERERER